MLLRDNVGKTEVVAPRMLTPLFCLRSRQAL